MTQDKDQGAFEAQRPTGLLDDPYTRRRFLRGAVVGAAGVAGAAGIAGVAMAHGTPKILANGGPLAPSITTPPTFSDNFEGTALDGTCTTSYGGSGQSGTSRYYLFLGSNLPAGNYSFDLTQKLNSNASGPISAFGATSATLPWDYGSAGNPIHVDVEAAGSITTSCSSAGSAQGTGHAAPLPVAFTLAATSDVLIYVHLNYSGTPSSGDQTIFTGALTGPVSKTLSITVTVA